jgi:indole-3-glycerol phosphate synthase
VYLDEIIAAHRSAAFRDTRNLDSLVEEALSMGPTRGFGRRLRDDSDAALAVVAEIKRKSPSKGVLNADLDPAVLAMTYEEAGASCVSVLTDERFFGGSADDLRAARAAVGLPILRKDFTVARHDVCDARLMGADCLLLIVAALNVDDLRAMHALALEIGLDVLVETHDEHEVDIALEIGARIIGVNQRDLRTFVVDHDRALRMAATIPSGVIKVAESGVRGAEDAARLRDSGYDAVLVGETLLVSADPASALSAIRVR